MLRTPLRSADRALHRFLVRALEKHVDPSPALATTSERCRQIVWQALPQVPRQAAVARTLAMSTRSLQRALDGEGTSFAAIVDDVRAELARALLKDARRSVAEVAAALGFAESSAFSRAFVR